MKTITVKLEDELHQRAQGRARELGTTLPELVHESLAHFIDGGSEYDRRKQLETETLASIGKFQGSDRLPREQAHDRDAFR